MRAYCFLVLLALPALLPTRPAVAADPLPVPVVRPMPRPGASDAVAAAITFARAQQWNAALSAGARAGGVGRDIADWHRLRAGKGSFAEARAFVARRPDWPGLPYLRSKVEPTIPATADPQDVLAFFDGTAPATGSGAVALIDAQRATGADAAALATARAAWVGLDLSPGTESRLLALYPDDLMPLHEERLDDLLWQGNVAAAGRQVDRLGDPDLRALARARLAVRADTDVSDAIGAVPARLRSDGGLVFDRFRYRLAAGRHADATAWMNAHSTSAAALGRPAAWARDRSALARRAMREGDAQLAYDTASRHFLTDGSGFADLEWLSGYLALTYLNRPADALAHFQRFRAAVGAPISLGRAGYWEGRAHEALGDAEGAANAYAFGAHYQTSFYGLLAADAAGLPTDPALSGTETYPPLRDTAAAGSSVLDAALLLQAAGERDLAERFLVHLSESLAPPEIGALADLALSLDEPHVALMLAKAAAQRGVELPRPYFPVVDLGVAALPVPRELALAVARRESEFDPSVSSSVGARGLMQLMPGTAADMARATGLPYSAGRLFSDPAYNATLGSAYLALLIRRFGDNPILVSAGYNAGPSRPARWLEDLGDPRGSTVAMVDWIEHIPFDETRNYVMRVAESIPVYRARLGTADAAAGFGAEIAGR